MSSIRKDIFTGAHVIISEQRGNRPVTTAKAVYTKTGEHVCPFCPGNEFMTPFETVDNKNWELRYFPNKYPALDIPGESYEPDSLYGCCDGAGLHEIFVDTRNHEEEIKDFTEDHAEAVISAIRDRFIFYNAKPEARYVQIFKNKGSRAGATQEHSHWQIVAGGFIPSLQQAVSKSLSRYKRQTGKCLYCAVLDRELNEGVRLIYENDSFVAIAPYASRFTYETWIVPKRHFSTLSELQSSELAEFSKALRGVLSALDGIKQDIDYNILFMDAPKTRAHSLFHWHAQIIPRMGGLAGYEFSTGSYINHITPEHAAKMLRDLI